MDERCKSCVHYPDRGYWSLCDDCSGENYKEAKMEKNCNNCKYEEVSTFCDPCYLCDREFLKWEPKEEEVDNYHEAKFDQGKVRLSLIPFNALKEIAKVLMHGLDKYKKKNSWQDVPDAEERYKDALLRHVADYSDGERIDHDSGLRTLAHIGCNVLFLLWFELKGEEK